MKVEFQTLRKHFSSSTLWEQGHLLSKQVWNIWANYGINSRRRNGTPQPSKEVANKGKSCMAFAICLFIVILKKPSCMSSAKPKRIFDIELAQHFPL